MVSYALHDLVCEWMAREVITFERLVSVREQFNAVLSGSNQRLREQADHLHRELDRVGKQIGHLLTAIERGGWTEEIQERLDTRKREKLQIETDLTCIEQKLKMGKLKVSDEVLRYMADHFAEALTSRHPDYARQLIQMVVPKVAI